MTSEFLDLQNELNSQKNKLAMCESLYAEMSDPAFDPLDSSMVNFTGYESAEEIGRFLAFDVPYNESIHQLAQIHNNITLLQTTVVLIEAQKVYKGKSHSVDPNLSVAISADADAFSNILKQTFDLNTRNKESSTGEKILESSFFKTIGRITDDYAAIQRDDFSRAIESLKSGQLLDRILQLRLHFVQFALQNNSVEQDRIWSSLNASLLIRKSIDEGIFADSDPLKKMAQEALSAAGDLIEPNRRMLDEMHKALAGIYEMGDDYYGTREFQATKYNAVSMKPLSEFTP